MNRYFTEGAIGVEGPAYYKHRYDMANRTCNVQVDGSFAISKFAIAHAHPLFVEDSFYGNLTLEQNKHQDVLTKKVQMLGHSQEVLADQYRGTFFLADKASAVLLEVSASSPITYQFGFLLALTQMTTDQSKVPNVILETVQNKTRLVIEGCGTLELDCNVPIRLREIEGAGYHFEIVAAQTIELVFTWNTVVSAHQIKEEALRYNASLVEPRLSGKMQALYASCLNVCHSMFKEVQGWSGFFAGIGYQSPARTYYRDSYYTALPLLASHPHLVAEQIVTLTSGIFADGTTPSGVGIDGAYWWANHHDGGSYLWLLCDAYLEKTGDLSLLEKSIKGKPLRSWLEEQAARMVEKMDEHHLIERASQDRHDWADNVFREGYVTYELWLCAKALQSAGKWLQSERFGKASQDLVQGIETHLWDENKGYYLNYRSANRYEDHLSIDTVGLAVFDLVDPLRQKRMLTNMEALLESKHNQQQPFGDWGVMCVYPPYQYKADLVEKSSYPYVYHNGSDWPYWSAFYALAKVKHQMEWHYPLTRWFDYGIEQGWYTPIEYYNPITAPGSALQGWSGFAAYTIQYLLERGEL